LTKFSDCCLKHKNEIAKLYGMAIRRDVHNKPVRQLLEFLNLTGVRHRKLKTIKEEEKKIYLYSVQKESVDFLDKISARHSDLDTQDDWHDRRGNRKRNRLFTKKSPMRFPKTYRANIRGGLATALELIEKRFLD